MPQTQPLLSAKGPSGPVPLGADVAGALSVSRASTVNFSATTAGTQVKTGAGTVRGVHVNTGAAGASVSLYDGTSTSGTLLGTFTAVNPISADSLQWAFNTGLFVVVAGGAPNVTISYN